MRYIKLVFLFVSYNLFAQVINIETLRRPTDSTNLSKWTGSISLDLSLIKNTNDIFRVTNEINILYNDRINFWLFVNNLNFQKVENISLVNRGTHHLRYNRRISPRIKWEIFGQAQYDAISKIDFRGLLGTGPRFKLSHNDDYKFYLGTLVMYEHEKASIDIIDRLQRDLRGSAYLSFNLKPTKSLEIISTSYYQPKLNDFSDFRLSSNTSLVLQIFENLLFKFNFNYFFDAVPVSPEVPKLQYELTNGLIYNFSFKKKPTRINE